MVKRDRKYYRIGQVSKIVGIEPHVLRFWESQFKQIQPKRISRQRLYRSRDLEIIKRIKELLYKEGYTIAGAKRRLQEEFGRKPRVKKDGRGRGPSSQVLDEIIQELLEIKKILSK